VPNKEMFKQYLEYYCKMDIELVAEMFAEDIILRDWKISVQGKCEAVRETLSNFNASESIEIEILRLYEATNAVAGELKIVVDRSEILYVTDIITFDDQGKISSIRAYIGRAD